MANTLPDRAGYFGQFGGRYVPETLMAALDEFEGAYKKLRRDRDFKKELDGYLTNYVGRPTPLTEAEDFASLCGDFRKQRVPRFRAGGVLDEPRLGCWSSYRSGA